MVGPVYFSANLSCAVRGLGPPRIERDGEPAAVDTPKAIALLAYLVLDETSQRRQTLVGLLWPESDQALGRSAEAARRWAR